MGDKIRLQNKNKPGEVGERIDRIEEKLIKWNESENIQAQQKYETASRKIKTENKLLPSRNKEERI